MVIIERCVCGCQTKDGEAHVEDTGCLVCSVGEHEMVLWKIDLAPPFDPARHVRRYINTVDIA
jgi:hypothetical protein